MFTCVLLGAMFGLTWAVVAALKDTQVAPGGYMYVKGSNNELVKVRPAHSRHCLNAACREQSLLNLIIQRTQFLAPQAMLMWRAPAGGQRGHDGGKWHARPARPSRQRPR